MGNLSTHEEVGASVVTGLQERGADERFTYLLLGNFMTDVSQFRDPYAFMLVKSSSGLLKLISSSVGRAWAAELFGVPTTAGRDGALVGFLRELARFLAHLYFSETSQASSQLIATPPLPASEVQRIFNNSYTQYFPHEHLDNPPFENRFTRLYQTGKRQMLSYLEEQLACLAEELTDLQRAWQPVRQGTPDDRVDLLVRLGHLLHAVEDFFFHSNTAELWLWRRLLLAEPQRDPARNEEDRRALLGEPARNALGLTSLAAPPSIHLRRLLARRLRRPEFNPVLDSGKSMDATEFVYTGGFGSTDVFHTIGGAFEALNERADLLGPISARLRNHKLALIRVLFNRAERVQAARDPSAVERLMNEHQFQLEEGVVDQELAKLAPAGPEAIAALREAFRLDREFNNEHGKLPWKLPSIGMFLIKVVALMQAELRTSDDRVGGLDEEPESVFQLSSSNGASTENVGTHSLMSKDSIEKPPMRLEAVRGAKYASETVATLMIDPPLGTLTIIDWKSVLEHLLRYPLVDPARWEETVFTTANPMSPIRNISDRPAIRPASALSPPGKLRGQLEKRYVDLEKSAQRRIRAPFDDLRW